MWNCAAFWWDRAGFRPVKKKGGFLALIFSTTMPAIFS
jgi:hypothetical protein